MHTHQAATERTESFSQDAGDIPAAAAERRIAPDTEQMPLGHRAKLDRHNPRENAVLWFAVRGWAGNQ